MRNVILLTTPVATNSHPLQNTVHQKIYIILMRYLEETVRSQVWGNIKRQVANNL